MREHAHTNKQDAVEELHARAVALVYMILTHTPSQKPLNFPLIVPEKALF
jgi:hypothetical protein